MSQFVAVMQINDDSNSNVFFDQVRVFDAPSLDSAFDTCYQATLDQAKQSVTKGFAPNVLILTVRVARLFNDAPINFGWYRDNDVDFKQIDIHAHDALGIQV